jgi:hypothetical protein
MARSMAAWARLVMLVVVVGRVLRAVRRAVVVGWERVRK